MPTTLDFTGNATTFIGFVGVVLTPFLLYYIFRSFNNSPLRK
jgi:hypothetical protein